jgi:hypothetical protein
MKLRLLHKQQTLQPRPQVLQLQCVTLNIMNMIKYLCEVMFVYCVQVRAPGDYRLTFRNPPECEPSNCDVFVGVDTNTGDSSYLDIYLEGQADGWVAVGFSSSRSMVNNLYLYLQVATMSLYCQHCQWL